MIPKYWELMLPLLKHLSDDKPRHWKELEPIMVKEFNLTEEERHQLKPSGDQTLFNNRIGWAIFELKKAELVTREKGIMQITEDGKKILQTNPPKIDRKFLLQLPTYAKFYQSMMEKRKEKQQEEPEVSENQSPEDKMIDGINEIRRGLESEILEKIKSCSPDFFEKTVVQLLEKMGYGDGTPTGKSGDGGIDGMIKQDKLGLDEIYVQAKRWENTVPGKEVRDFAGSLSGKKSKKGIFITTSNFSRDAIDFIKTVDSKIILIDGEELAKLMFNYNIGFESGAVYQLKKIDEDFFSE